MEAKKQVVWKLIIYMPVYNSQKTIHELLDRISKVELPQISERTIILVNDGSTDKTAELIKKSTKKIPYLKLINKGKNQGPIPALFDGMKEASKVIGDSERTIVVRMDSDLEHQPEDIWKLLEPIISGETKISTGYIPFDSRNGLFLKWFNQIIGLNESRYFLKMDIPQFCPGFRAIRGDLFLKLYPLIEDKSNKFRERYGKNMLTIDFITLVLSKKLDEKLVAVKLFPIEDKYIKKQPLRKLFDYLDYHKKTVEFLRSEV